MNVEDRESQAVFFYGNMKKKTLKTDNKINQYIVILNLAGIEYKAKSDTILEGLEMLKPELIKSRGILKIKKGKLETEILMWPIQVKRLLINKTYREILQKRLNLALKII